MTVVLLSVLDSRRSRDFFCHCYGTKLRVNGSLCCGTTPRCVGSPSSRSVQGRFWMVLERQVLSDDEWKCFWCWRSVPEVERGPCPGRVSSFARLGVGGKDGLCCRGLGATLQSCKSWDIHPTGGQDQPDLVSPRGYCVLMVPRTVRPGPDRHLPPTIHPGQLSCRLQTGESRAQLSYAFPTCDRTTRCRFTGAVFRGERSGPRSRVEFESWTYPLG